MTSPNYLHQAPSPGKEGEELNQTLIQKQPRGSNQERLLQWVLKLEHVFSRSNSYLRTSDFKGNPTHTHTHTNPGSWQQSRAAISHFQGDVMCFSTHCSSSSGLCQSGILRLLYHCSVKLIYMMGSLRAIYVLRLLREIRMKEMFPVLVKWVMLGNQGSL